MTIVTPRGDFAVSIAEPSPRGGITPLIASKLLRADVIIIDACIVEHGSAALHHRGWSGDVIDGTCGVGNSRSNLRQVPREHFRAEVPSGVFCSARLKAVSRRRVVNARCSS